MSSFTHEDYVHNRRINTQYIEDLLRSDLYRPVLLGYWRSPLNWQVYISSRLTPSGFPDVWIIDPKNELYAVLPETNSFQVHRVLP